MFIVTSPWDGFVETVPVAVIYVLFIIFSTLDKAPGISTVTKLLLSVAVTPSPVNFQDDVSVVREDPLYKDPISVGVGPGSAQVPSPLR